MVVSGTIYSFEFLLSESQSDAAEPPAEQSYQVAIPYFDLTLDRYLGVGRLAGRQFVYVTNVEATSRDGAIERARARFRQEIDPFDGEAEPTVSNISLGDEITVQATSAAVAASGG